MISWKNISMQDLAGYISEELRKKDIDSVLVGGACVTLYSNNRYQSYDLDYVTYEDMNKVKKALKDLGFIEKSKYFQHPDCLWFIEFVSPPIAVGNEFIKEFNYIKTSVGTIKLIKPTDSVKDRLSSFYHWNDKQGLNQALSICIEQEIDLLEIEEWSKQENQMEKFEVFVSKLNDCKTTNKDL